MISFESSFVRQRDKKKIFGKKKDFLSPNSLGERSSSESLGIFAPCEVLLGRTIENNHPEKQECCS